MTKVIMKQKAIMAKGISIDNSLILFVIVVLLPE